MTSRADSLTHEDLQKAKESGMADIVEKLRNIDNISGDIEESEIERISIIGDAAAAEIERLRAEVEQNRIDLNEYELDAQYLRAEIKELHSQLEFADMAISRFNNGEELQSVLELNNKLRAELNETSRLAYEWMVCHDKLKAGEPYTFPSPPYNKTIDDLRAALAEARGLLVAFYRADIDMHKYDRTAKWLERNS